MKDRKLPKNISQYKDGLYCYRYRLDGKTKAIYSRNLEELVLLKESNFKAEPKERYDYNLLKKHISKNATTTEKKIAQILPEEQFVYFVSDGRYVKIGVSKDVYKRVNQMQTGNSSLLKVVSVIKTHAPYLVEYALHEILKTRQISGEWYDILDLFENGEGYAINEV